ncbi:MAG TPA: hypothetical protein VFZ71_04445 [Pyrinomonadaceae bacterium]
MAKQGDFIKQLKQKPQAPEKRSFSWDKPVSSAARESRIKGALNKSPKLPAAPLGADIPKTYDGRIDKQGIERDLTKTVKSQAKAEKQKRGNQG